MTICVTRSNQAAKNMPNVAKIHEWSLGDGRRALYVPTGTARRDVMVRKYGEPMAVYFRDGVKVAEQWSVDAE